jgi:HEPN domain-containing protein
MDRFQVVSYWLNSAQHDFEVAETLFKNAKYDWCLFIGHLVLEKTLKAFYFKQYGSVPPRTHDLIRLADKVKIQFDEETIEFLDGVNTFHIAARYPDEKMKFYRMCTLEFTEEQFRRIKEIYQCLLEKIRQ